MVTAMTERIPMLHKYMLSHLEHTVCCDILSFSLHNIMSAFNLHNMEIVILSANSLCN